MKKIGVMNLVPLAESAILYAEIICANDFVPEIKATIGFVHQKLIAHRISH